jgi:HPt (histidine-containing phosphotransfer) domain-containing protein
MTFQISQNAVEKYIQRRAGDLQTLKAAFDAKNYEQIMSIAHQLRGNAETFGFGDLGEHAKNLEKSANVKDREQLDAELQWFENWLKEKIPA